MVQEVKKHQTIDSKILQEEHRWRQSRDERVRASKKASHPKGRSTRLVVGRKCQFLLLATGWQGIIPTIPCGWLGWKPGPKVVRLYHETTAAVGSGRVKG